MTLKRAPTPWLVVTCFALMFISSQEALAQICRPAVERTGELGCWITVDAELGKLPQGPVFWHLDTYATRVEAEAAKEPRGIVVESLGNVWLFTINIAGWRPSAGKRIAEIGPLPVEPDVFLFSAIYGGNLHAWHDGARTSAFGAGGLVYAFWRNMSGDSGWHHDRKGWGLSRYSARRSSDASHGDRNGDPSRVGPNTPRLNTAANDSSARLDTKGTLRSAVRCVGAIAEQGSCSRP